MLFFAIVYVVEGVGQARVGVVWQPLNYYLKQSFGWTPVQISLSLAILDLPWVIKPLFGLISDFVPLFGYRRRAYLLLANVAAVLAYAWVAMAGTPARLVAALLLTSFAMAIASTLCGALLVENGQQHRATGRFVTQQWLWFNVATMASAVGGGELIAWLAPAGALRAAALIAAGLPLAAAVATLLLVDEPRAATDLAALRRTFAGLLAALRARRLYLIAASCSCIISAPASARRCIFISPTGCTSRKPISARSPPSARPGGSRARCCIAGSSNVCRHARCST